jgi:hypothetical protein
MIYYCPVCDAEVGGRYEFCPECGAACWLDPKEARGEFFARIRSQGESLETDELAKIEYLLEALDEARERGELSRSAYRLLAQRYLRRAHEITLKLSERAGTTPTSALTVPAARETPVDDDGLGASSPSFPVAPPPPAPQPAPLRPPQTPRPPSGIAEAARSVPWTVWVALAGALLVIGAAAGFAIYAWPSFGAATRLGTLLTVTALFYWGGLWLRRRLAVIGISLLALGAALILVDGWLLLSAAGLHGLWWWALLFAVGSAVHWGMGAWLRVKLFAVTGAIAQIAWWWLLGTALSWPLGARAAILTTVGLVWMAAGLRVRRGPAQSIGQLLGLAGAGLAVGAAVVGMVGGLVNPGWSAVVAAFVIAVTATAALELQRVAGGRWLREASVVALLPLPVAFVALSARDSIWSVAAGCGCALALLVFAWWRGGHARVLAGSALLAVELPVVIVHAFAATGWNKVAVILGTELLLGLGFLLVSLWLRTTADPDCGWKGAHDLARVLRDEAWLLMAGAAAVLVPAVELSWGNQARPVSLSVLSSLALVVWLVAAAARWRVEKGRQVQQEATTSVLIRNIAPTIVAYALSLHLASIIERWAGLPTHLAWVAAALFVADLIWSHLRGPVRRFLGCPQPVVEAMWALTPSVLAAVVLVAAISRHTPPGYASGAVLAMIGLAWVAETARFGRPYYLPAASAALAAATGLIVWNAGSQAAGALAAALAGGVLALVPLALPRKAKWPLWWSLGAAFAAAGGVAGAFSTPWSATLALAALAAALAGPALLGLPVFAGPFAFAAFAALCSLESWAGVSPWVGTAVTIVAAALMLAPTIARRGGPQLSLGAAWSLALSGVFTLATVLLATAVAALKSAPPAWLSGGEWSIAVLLFALAAYCAAWSLWARAKWGRAAGSSLLLAGLLVLLGAAGVGVPEAYFTTVAAWGVVVAWRLSQGKRHRNVTKLTDIVTVIVGLGGPALLMAASGLRVSSTSHAIWLICLAAAMIGAGVGLRVRLYFGFGLGAVVLAAFWLTSSHLSAVPGLIAIVAVVGGGLIALGAVGERRRARLARAAKDAFAGWR